MEDHLNFLLGNPISWFLVCNIVSTQLDEIWKSKSIFENGRQPQLFWNWKTTFFFKWKTISFFWKWKITSNSFENQRLPHFYKSKNGRWPPKFKTTMQPKTNKEQLLCSFKEQYSTVTSGNLTNQNQKFLALFKNQKPNKP